MKVNFSFKHPYEFCSIKWNIFGCSQVPVLIFFFLKVEKLNKAEYEGLSDMSVFFLKVFLETCIPCAPVISSKKYQFSNYSDWSSVSWSSEMLYGVIYLKRWGITQCHVTFWTLDFCSCFFVFNGTHMGLNSVPFQRPVFVGFCVKSLVCLCMRLVFICLWSEFQALFSSLVLGPSPMSIW